MSEFRIHHLVSELMKVLGTQGKEGPEVYTDLLLKNVTPYITTQVSSHAAKRKIAEFTKTPAEFLNKYDELKSKNVRDLDALVYLLSKLSEDKDVVSTLKDNSDKLLMPMDKISLPAPGTKMSQEEVSELRNQLLAASSAASTQASEVFRKMMREKQAKKNTSLSLPVLSPWVYERPFLTGDFIKVSRSTIEPGVPLGTLPLGMQEMTIVHDLLTVMMGTEGKYILVRQSQDRSITPYTFQVDRSLDTSLQELVNRILPICNNYSTIMHFIEDKSSFEFGVVNHALCGAMRTLVKEYNILVAQLEHQFRQGQLPLQRFWFYVQPCMQTMEILASISSSVDRGACAGGSVLSLLHEKTVTMIGDMRAQELCLFLTQSACAPYFEILEKWIYKGIIKDPYCEFMIEENEALQKEKLQQEYNDAYWEQRYTICRERSPIFLETIADKILRTGKYLNVVRQCGHDPRCPNAEEILYTLKERQYVDQIDKAYQYASKLLLELLMEERELVHRLGSSGCTSWSGRGTITVTMIKFAFLFPSSQLMHSEDLQSIKRYFLLEQGDFFVHLMDITEEEMKKRVDDIIPSRLESLLELAVRTSQANSDPFKDDLRVDLLPYDLNTQLLRILSIESRQEKAMLHEMDPTELNISGLEAFSFDYVVRWPESLILSRKALTKYQMLFRHLFYCKHVERTLSNIWLLNKEAKRFTLYSSRWYAAAFALRQRMLHLVQNLQYYMMFEVVEPHWHILQDNLRKVSNIDDVLSHHTDFLDKCLKDCMLTNPDIIKNVSKLMLVCVTFANCIQRVTQTMNVDAEVSLLVDTGTPPKSDKDRDKQDSERRRTATKVVSEHVEQLNASDDFANTVHNFDSNFSSQLISLLDKLSLFSTANCEHNMMNIIHRLDFNGFYTVRLEKLAAERSMAALGDEDLMDVGGAEAR